MYAWETKEVKESFYEYYENEWDYWFKEFDMGSTYGEFLSDNQDRFGYLMNEERPEHISDIPDEAYEAYMIYLKFYIKEYGNTETVDLMDVERKYGIEKAIEEYYYSYIQ